MNPNPFEPAYLSLLRSGQFERRVEELERMAAKGCRLCPRHCHVNRGYDQRGACGAGFDAAIVSWGPHHGEEPCISGRAGSGTLFVGHCNMFCIHCQNADISQDHENAAKHEVPPETIADYMLRLQEAECHNINWVSPTHNAHSLMRALLIATQKGLRLPIVYNTGGYDSVDALQLMDGAIDIYMPDLKYANDAHAKSLSASPRYVESARAAIQEMHSQTGPLVLNAEGIALRGLLIRILVLPENLEGAKESLDWTASNLGPDTAINLMSQYRPAHQSHTDPRINRGLRTEEYMAVVEYAKRLGFARLIL